MKTILGLDLGPASIGWASVLEDEIYLFNSDILAAGVCRCPLTDNESTEFGKGDKITTNSNRTAKRGARRNNFRFKLRREKLRQLLIDYGIITHDTIIAENGADSTYNLLRLRSLAATERIELADFGRVLMMLNKKRGYKSNRKTDPTDTGDDAIDSRDIAIELQNRNITPGQYALELMERGANRLPQFFKSDLKKELKQIFENQQQYYPQLTSELLDSIDEKNESKTWGIISKVLNIVGVKRIIGRGRDKKIEELQWRVASLTRQVDATVLAQVISKINGAITAASGNLSAMSERSKNLFVSKKTIGEYKFDVLSDNPHYCFKKITFYRKDYEEEFEKIWETQAKYHKELTPELKKLVRDKTIFYQRPLKSQKHTVAFCELESVQKTVENDGKTITVQSGPRVAPKASPIFQQFRILEKLCNLKINGKPLSIEMLDKLADNLEFCDKMSAKEILLLLGQNPKTDKLNYKEILGNRTASTILNACVDILEMSGYDMEVLLEGLIPAEKARKVADMLAGEGIDSSILYFDPTLSGDEIERQPAYRLWHTIYSAEDAKNEKLIHTIASLLNISPEQAKIFAYLRFEPDYGSLSSKAIKKILPFLKEGMPYSTACKAAGYKEPEPILTDRLDPLPKNSLRSPVVEKILNQMIRVVNELMAIYGRFDEIRIELAREIKKPAEERKELKSAIDKRTNDNNRIVEILKAEPFKIKHPSDNDILRYRLYMELELNGFKTLYSNTYISKERLFSGDFQREHIIPKALAFDNSFSNQTLETSGVNDEKGKMTAIDYVIFKGEISVDDYLNKIDTLEKKGAISHTKAKNLRCRAEDIPSDFLNRDLALTQYITRKAREILEQVTPNVTVTIGSITARLREDWGLIDLMKELNWDKYDRLGLTEQYKNKHGKTVKRIKNWTKRNDNRHHALDAITIAFTRREFIKYLSNLNAQSDKDGEIYAIRTKFLKKDSDHKGNPQFKSPMPEGKIRQRVKEVLESMLIAVKDKNKVVTSNFVKTKSKSRKDKTIEENLKEKEIKKYLTPRLQLHDETFYGRNLRYDTSEVKVGASLTAETIGKVASKAYREALLRRLEEFGGDSKKAFTGKNSLAKNPIYIDEAHTSSVPEKVKIVELKPIYTKRTEINKKLNIANVLDTGVKKILEERLEQYGGDKAKAFSNLTANPIYLNREKGITIKKVTVKASRVSNPIAIHKAKNHLGNELHAEDGSAIPVDYVAPAGNYQAAFYETPEGKVEEIVVTNFEAVRRAIQTPPLPIIDRDYNSDKGWKFLMSLKKNEYVVFPAYKTSESGKTEIKTFDPKEIDLLNSANYPLISPNLFRVQMLSEGDYTFRHHLETTAKDKKEKDKEKDKEQKKLTGITYKRISSTNQLKDVVKVRVDALGRIVAVGEE